MSTGLPRPGRAWLGHVHGRKPVCPVRPRAGDRNFHADVTRCAGPKPRRRGAWPGGSFGSLIRTFKFKSRLRSSLLEASLFCSGPSPRRPWPSLGVSPPLSLLQPCPVPGDLSRPGARAPAPARAPPAAHRAHPSLRSGLAPGAGQMHRLPRRPRAAPLLPLLLRCPPWRPVPPAALRELLSVWPPSGFRARAEAARCSALCGVFGARSSVRGMSRVLDA